MNARALFTRRLVAAALPIVLLVYACRDAARPPAAPRGTLAITGDAAADVRDDSAGDLATEVADADAAEVMSPFKAIKLRKGGPATFEGRCVAKYAGSAPCDVWDDKNKIKPPSGGVDNMCDVYGPASPATITFRSLDGLEEIDIQTSDSSDFEVGAYYRVNLMGGGGGYGGVALQHAEKIAGPADAGPDGGG